jgi:hypothetical protein
LQNFPHYSTQFLEIFNLKIYQKKIFPTVKTIFCNSFDKPEIDPRFSSNLTTPEGDTSLMDILKKNFSYIDFSTIFGNNSNQNVSSSHVMLELFRNSYRDFLDIGFFLTNSLPFQAFHLFCKGKQKLAKHFNQSTVRMNSLKGNTFVPGQKDVSSSSFQSISITIQVEDEFSEMFFYTKNSSNFSFTLSEKESKIINRYVKMIALVNVWKVSVHDVINSFFRNL